MEIGSRQIAHYNVTEYPKSEWTLQQFREAIQKNETRSFLFYDLDSIYSADLD